MKEILLVSIVALAFLGCIGTAAATDYYVSTTGSDSNSGLGPDSGQAWKTLMHAISVAHGGDVVYIRGGTYSSQEIWMQYDSGHGGSAATGYLSIMNYPGETPVFSGGRWILYGVKYIKVQGISFVNPCYFMTLSAQSVPDHIELIGCNFSGKYSIYQGAIMMCGTNLLIENNTLNLTPSGSTNDHGIYIFAGTNNGESHTTNGVVIRGNRVSGVSGYLIHIYDELKTYGEPDRLITNVTIERNYIENSDMRSGILIATGSTTQVDGVVIKNNIVRDVSAYGIATLYGSNGLGISNIQVYNNDIYGFGSAGVYVGGGTDSVDIENNIIDNLGTSSSHITVSGGTGVTADNNLYWGSPARLSGVTDGNQIVADPLFVDPSSGDFRLQATSPAIDTGTSDVSSVVTTDFLGNPRPMDGDDSGTAEYDIGAYEYIGATCVEDWVCTDWSVCSGGEQARTCTDQNDCGTTSDKPPETQDCAESPAPVLFFSDLTSGPKTGWEGSSTKGAAVTIWGLNLGSSRGSSYVTVGGVDLTSDSDYAEWGATDNNAMLDAQHTQQRITFWLNSAMSTGDTSITVTVNGVTSNPLSFTVRDLGSNHIYFVSPSGSNSDSGLCAMDQGTCGPWQTIYYTHPSNGYVSAGDIVYIRSGIYDENDNGNGGAIEIRAADGSGGTEALPIAWIGYPEERPVLTHGLINVHWPSWAGRTDPFPYVTLSKLEFNNAMNSISNTGRGNGWRFIGNFFNLQQGHNQGGVVSCMQCSDIYWFGNKFVGGGGDDWDHLVYPGNQNDAVSILDNHHVAYNEVTGYNGNLGDSGHGLGGAVFNLRPNGYLGGSVGTVYYYNNYMHDCGFAQFIYIECDGPTDYVYIYNNLVTNVNEASGDPAWGLVVMSGKTSGPQTMYAYNNVFYESGADSMVFSANEIAKIYTKNNIIYESVGQKYGCADCGNFVFNSDHDLMYGAGAEPTGSRYTITNEISADPLFVDASSDNFQLQSDSPAIDTGTSSVSSIVIDDLLGDPRPTDGDGSGTAGWDIGAYEYTGAYTPPVCQDGDSDGYGSPASSSCAYSQLDCNDNNPDINPGGTEICGDDIDQDCSGSDLACPSCSDGIQNQGETGVDCGGPCPACTIEIIIDNTDPGFSTSGTWWSSGYPNPYGTDSLGSDVNEGSVATWTPDITQAGEYEVYAWWTAGTGRVNDARYTISHASGSNVVTVDQKVNGGQWNLLGTFTFDTGMSGHVSLSDTSTDPNYAPGSVSDSVCADAVRFVYSGQFYHPADTGEDCTIDLDEMTEYIEYWYADSTNYPTYRVIEAIGFYKSGGNSCK